MAKRSRTGFTLVELLVVIGIIALLISILLPSLNRARQQANLIKCASNLRQVGLMLSIYSSESKGYAPYGDVPGSWDGAVNYSYSGSPAPAPWLWPDTLSIMMSRKVSKIPGYVNCADKFNPAFVDVDTMAFPGGDNRISHYIANARIMPRRLMYDPVNGGYYQLRKIATVKRSSEIFSIWDGPQILDFSTNGGSPTVADAIDGYQAGFGHGLVNPPANSWWNPTMYTNRVGLGVSTSSLNTPSATDIKAVNVDLSLSNQYNPPCEMRFRHVKNTTGNFLALDGHVESRQVGTVLVKDICIPQ